jgi:hypothetical protein
MLGPQRKALCGQRFASDHQVKNAVHGFDYNQKLSPQMGLEGL